MLLDPLAFQIGQTYAAPTGGTPNNFRRTAFGKYVCADASFSLDQPARLMITSTPRPTGNSSYKLEYQADKNVPAVNGIAQQDDTLKVALTISGNMRSFTNADFYKAVFSLFQIWVENGNRVLAGES